MREKFSLKQDFLNQFQRRLILFFLIVCSIFITFLVTLFNLQIIQGDRYTELSLHNVLTYERITAPRGTVYDRHGNILITNESVYQLYLRKASLRHIINNPEIFDQTAFLLDISPEELREKYEQEYAAEVMVKNNLSFEELVMIEEQRHLLPEIIIHRGFLRRYPHGEISGHITGHLSRINRAEYERLKDKDYTPHSWIGKSGIEGQYEELLKGKDGEEILLRRSRGTKQSWEFIPARPGHTLDLTISLPLQEKAWDLLQDKNGSIIVIQPHNGEVLAMVSSPSFNPQHFVTQHFFRENPAYLQREDVSLFNKAIQGRYPPGSIFKLFTALSALGEGIITPSTTFYCAGQYYYPGWRHPFQCNQVHGNTTLQRALQYSCNIYFYEVGVRLGVNRIQQWAQKLGLEENTGVDLPFESTSFFPGPSWKSRFLGEGWVPANTIHLAIGQGYISVTPMEMVSFFSLLATNGLEYRPRLLKSYKTDNNERYETEPEIVREIIVSPNSWQALREGMWKVVNERGGTAYESRSKEVEYSGKTGTAENPHGKPHAWFAGYAPSREPEIAFIVLLENKGGGGVFAAPLAKELVDFYFSNK